MEYLGRNKDGITEVKVEDHDSVPWESEEKKVKFDQQLAEENARAQEASQTGGVWSWFRNSMLGRTFGLEDEDKTGKEAQGLWGWMRNSMLGRTFGLDDVSRAGGESKGLLNWFSNSMVGRWFGLDDESKTGKESQGLLGWMRNSMLGRTFGLDDVSRAGGESKGLWNWFSNSMVGRWFGLDDAGKATPQPAQKDDVIVEKGATEQADSNESSAKERSRTQEATKDKLKETKFAEKAGDTLLDSYFSKDKPSIGSSGTTILPSSLTGTLGQSLTASDLTSIQGRISSMREPLDHSQHSQSNTETTVDNGLSLDSIVRQGIPSLLSMSQSDQLTPDANDSVSTPQIPGQGISNNTERADPAQPFMPQLYNGRE